MPSVLVITNAKIATLANGATDFAQAIAIDTASGLVLETGSTAAITAKYAQHNPQSVDVGGRTIIPGLIDSHLHFIREGLNFNLELRWDGLTSLAAGLAMIQKQAAVTPPGQWVRVVGGWYEHQFTERRLPTVEELNAAGGDVPVFVLHLYDCAIVNRAGMRVLGYNKDTPNPPSGEIQRDSAGNPTGILIARPNAFLLYNTLDKLPKLSFDDQVNSTVNYQRELHRFGLTSCLDPGGGFQNYPNDYKVIQQLDQSGQLAVRIHFSLFPQKPKHELEDFQRWADMVKPGDGSPFFKHLGAGEMLAFSAADFEDFKEPRPDLPKEMEGDLEPIVRFLASRNWPFRLHATYGESIDRDLAVFEKIERETPGSISSLRWFIDHAETISDADIKRIKALGGGIAIQHRMSFQGEYFVERYGAKAAENAPPIAAMRAAGLHVGGGTDGTRVATYNPWVSLAWLVTGKTVGGLSLYAPSNIVSRLDALRLWTTDNAWFCKAESTQGTLAAGMYADLAVLSKDFFTVNADEIKSIESLMTVVGGKVVYTDPRFTAAPTAVYQPKPVSISPSWSPVKAYGGYQIAGSHSWPVLPIDAAAKSMPHATGTTAGSGGMHAKVNPQDFFMYGHDC